MASNPIFPDVKPFPGKPAAAPAPAYIGHNKPPLEDIVPEDFRAELLREKPDFLEVFENLLGAAERAAVIDDASLGRAGDLVKRYRACASHIEATHKTVKEPHLLGGRLVDGQKNGLMDRLGRAKAEIERKANSYVAEREARERAERERIAAEQRKAAEEAREDEAAPLAPAAPARPEPVRSDEGATVSGKTVWNSDVYDIAKAFKAVKSDPKVQEAIAAAIARLVRAGQRDIPGVRIWPTTKANIA